MMNEEKYNQWINWLLKKKIQMVENELKVLMKEFELNQLDK